MTIGEGTAKKYAKVLGTNHTYELCNASQSQCYYDPSELHHQSNFLSNVSHPQPYMLTADFVFNMHLFVFK